MQNLFTYGVTVFTVTTLLKDWRVDFFGVSRPYPALIASGTYWARNLSLRYSKSFFVRLGLIVSRSRSLLIKIALPLDLYFNLLSKRA